MMMRLFFVLFFIRLSAYSIAQTYLPQSNGQIIKHTYYTLSYLENFEQAEWVYYTLTPEMLKGNAHRTNNFRPDPNVLQGSAQLTDYKNSEFDKGHLMPAGDMKMNQLAMSESFYMSNISPQLPSFNRGIWRSLETLIREWASKEKLHIATGGIIAAGLPEIGINGVDVPMYFYKVIYDPTDRKMIAFVLPHEKGKKSLREYTVSVDQVEELTGIDFFPQLSDDIEEYLEREVNLSDWTFSIVQSYKTVTDHQIIPPSQCRGTAKSTGARCKNKTNNENNYCYAHQSQSLNSNQGRK